MPHSPHSTHQILLGPWDYSRRQSADSISRSHALVSLENPPPFIPRFPNPMSPSYAHSR
ncbi:hypothetical protein M413DRAFT_443766 [Hebeloma cylindrosporum]|uniref:Uncharacterized protein n=1 Tax=Hebeloma cylindrosporum TaxID=76867 RepID=A0A0C3C4T5_HEBCY|nr:hypothetical protein M413DRAFT_443766 [Hebeloma cylindrosporum h7]